MLENLWQARDQIQHGAKDGNIKMEVTKAEVFEHHWQARDQIQHGAKDGNIKMEVTKGVSGEKRVLHMNTKRVKLVSPGGFMRTHLMREAQDAHGTYNATFAVVGARNDPRRMLVTMDGKEVGRPATISYISTVV